MLKSLVGASQAALLRPKSSSLLRLWSSRPLSTAASSAAAAAAAARPATARRSLLWSLSPSLTTSALFSKPKTPLAFVRFGHGHASGAAESLSKGEGGVDGAVPESISQGTGIEHEELALLEQGATRFPMDVLSGPFGTVQHPVMVPSGHKARYVCCVGGGEHIPEHVPCYFHVHMGPLTACPECGQIFKLFDCNAENDIVVKELEGGAADGAVAHAAEAAAPAAAAAHH